VARTRPDRRLSLPEARRIALRAQGFGPPRPAKVGLAQVRKVVDRLGAVQIDAVNVVVRSHELPLFSRLGPYDRALFDRWLVGRREGFDYLAHAASYVPVALEPQLRWRMSLMAAHKRWLAFRHETEERHPGYVERVRAEVAERGPLTFGELEDPARGPRRTEADSLPGDRWWDPRPSAGKGVLEWLWRMGELAVAERRANFERAYDVAERVVPAEVRAIPTPAPEDAWRVLVRRSMQALGVAWTRDVADVFRLPVATTKVRLRELAEEGEVVPVEIEGTDEAAWLLVGARSTPVTARALLSPFDSLLWERTRNVRLFGFRHSFEIYVPEPQRVYGYYVLPFLLDERIVARVDLKADRAAGALAVRGAYAEDGVDARSVAGALAGELRAMAGWLGLDTVRVNDRGDLAPALRRALTTRSPST
jgi:uncharacterized protein YcaQ